MSYNTRDKNFGGIVMSRIKTIVSRPLEKKSHNCGECRSSCQSACKTSCTVGNQVCERNPVNVKENTRKELN